MPRVKREAIAYSALLSLRSKIPSQTCGFSSHNNAHTAIASPPKSESNLFNSTKSLLRCVPIVPPVSSVVSVSVVRTGNMVGINVARACAPLPSDSMAICVAEWLMNGVVWSLDMPSATRMTINVGAMPYVRSQPQSEPSITPEQLTIKILT